MIEKYRCPICANTTRAMEDPYRYICMACRKVWEIRDVLQDAMLRAEAAADDEAAEEVYRMIENTPPEDCGTTDVF